MSVLCDNCNQAQPDGMNYCDNCSMPLPKNQPIMPSYTQQIPVVRPDTIQTDTNTFVPDNWSPNQQYDATLLAVPMPNAPARPPTPIPVPAAPPTPFKAASKMKLVVTAGKAIGQEFILPPGEAEIGRRDEDNGFHPHVDLDSQDEKGFIHRSHAFVLYENGGWFVEDGGKPNGTRLRRNRQITKLGRSEKVPLQVGDEIIVGEIHLSFKPA